eukprot:10105999-Prorocentrum_lima.AAC.1
MVGIVARLPMTRLASSLTRYMGLAWWRTQQLIPARKRATVHPVGTAYRQRWEARPEEVVRRLHLAEPPADNWWRLALQRETWASLTGHA